MAEVARQSVGFNVQGINQHQQQQPQGLWAGMGMMGGALPYQTQQGPMGENTQGRGINGEQRLDFSNNLGLGLGLMPAEALRIQNEELTRVLNLMTERGLGGLESHHLKLIFQMHFEKTKQTAAQKVTLNMDIVMKHVEARVIDAGEDEGVFIDSSGKPSIAMRIALNDFGTINPLDLVKHTESSTNHNTSGWMVESKGEDQRGNNVGTAR